MSVQLERVALLSVIKERSLISHVVVAMSPSASECYTFASHTLAFRSTIRVEKGVCCE